MSDLAQAGLVNTVTGFSYGNLDAVQAEVARAAADAIRDIHKRAIPAIGRHLLAAKEALPHGAFTAWAEQELGINARTARNYMQASAWLAGKPATIAVLPPTVLYALSAPGVPDDLVQQILVDAAAGTSLSASAIQAQLTTARIEQAELKAAQRRKPDLTAAELRARKAKKGQRLDAEQIRETEQREQEKRDREERLAPLVKEVAGRLGLALSQELVDLAHRYHDWQSFSTLLLKAFGETPAAPPAYEMQSMAK